MRKNWPYFIVASLLNAVLITGAFIEFKLRGMALPELPAAPQPAWFRIDPFAFSSGIFLISFLLIVVITGLGGLIGSIIKSVQLQVSRYRLQGIHIKTQIRN
jgi:hypothetical protein